MGLAGVVAVAFETLYPDDLPLFGTAAMSEVVPTALILGHSFLKRLKCDLHQSFDS